MKTGGLLLSFLIDAVATARSMSPVASIAALLLAGKPAWDDLPERFPKCKLGALAIQGRASGRHRRGDRVAGRQAEGYLVNLKALSPPSAAVYKPWSAGLHLD